MAHLTGGLLDGLSKSFEITEGSGDRTTDSNEAIRAKIDTELDQSLSTTEGNIRGTDDDTLKTLSDQIDGIGGGLTAKQIAFMGYSLQPSLNDTFLYGETGAAPNTDFWVVTEDTGADVSIEKVSTTIRGLKIYAGATADSDAIASGKSLISWDTAKNGTTNINFEAYVHCLDLTGTFVFGLVREAEAEQDSIFWSGSNHWKATIECINDTVKASTGNKSIEDDTDISAYFTEDTWIKVNIILTSASTKYYINDTLIATHNAIPSIVLTQYATARNTSSINTTLTMNYINIWTE